MIRCFGCNGAGFVAIGETEERRIASRSTCPVCKGSRCVTLERALEEISSILSVVAFPTEEGSCVAVVIESVQQPWQEFVVIMPTRAVADKLLVDAGFWKHGTMPNRYCLNTGKREWTANLFFNKSSSNLKVDIDSCAIKP